MRPPARLLAATLCLMAALPALALPAFAQQAPPPTRGTAVDPEALASEAATRRAELEDLSATIKLSEDRQKQLEAEIGEIDKDRSALTDQLVTTASRIQALEGALSGSEERLARLDANAAAIGESLEARRGVLAQVLSALLRIGRRPPPAIVVRPEDALGAVRSAIAFGAVLPEIRVEAEALASDLAALVEVRDEVEAEAARLGADRTKMAEEQERLALLIEEKRKLGESSQADLEVERGRTEDLARRAASLKDLLTTLDERLASARRRDRDSRPGEARPPVDDSGRLRPAIAFAEARGRFPMPVRGVPVQGFGEDNGLGGTAQGVSVATRAGARVTAPCDGWVAYAGDFRSYGRLLILDGGDGYHVVMAGMERVDVELGQFVLTGEPVGTMGDRRLASAMAPERNVSQPVLYIEFRKDGSSIDPSPWWVASEDRKVGG